MTTFCVYCYGYGVGYTMQDIRYVWKHGLDSVGMSSEVELPQFRVLGHRQRATEINLTTGTHLYLSIKEYTLLTILYTKYTNQSYLNCGYQLKSINNEINTQKQFSIF